MSTLKRLLLLMAMSSPYTAAIAIVLVYIMYKACKYYSTKFSIISLPTITEGGARYLHLARNHYLVQYQALHEGKVHPIFSRPLDNEDRQYARFGHKNISDCNFAAPLPLVDYYEPFALVTPRELMPKLIDPRDNLSYSVFREEVSKVGRDMKMAVYEWARVDPLKRIPTMLQLINDSQSFAKSYNGYYETLRVMYYCTVDREPVLNSNAFEKVQDRRLDARIEEETRKLEALKDKYDKQKAVVDELLSHKNLLPHQNRNSWQHIPSVKVKQVVVVPFRPKNPAPPKGMIPRKENVGRPHRVQAFEHREQVDTEEEVYRKRLYLSRVLGHQYNGPTPVWDFGREPINLREVDENQFGALASARYVKRMRTTHQGDGAAAVNPVVWTAAANPVAWTQDMVEEEDNRYQNNFINFD